MNGTVATAAEIATKDLVNDVCYKYIAPTLCVFGVIGNIITLIVLSKQQLMESPYVYLKALAITDMSALFFTFPFLVFSRESASYSWKWYDAFVFTPFLNFFTASSIWITVVMTIDRFIFVKFPLWARWRCNRVNAQVRIWVILAITVVISVPCIFYYDVVQIKNKHEINMTHIGNIERYRLFPTYFKRGQFNKVLNIICIVLIHFIPLVVMGSINIYLICAIQQARVAREELNLRNNKETEWQKDQRRFTVTLISIVFLATISILPAAVMDILIQSGTHTYYIQIVQIVSNLLMWLNLSMNFVLYCAFNKKFVKVLKELLGRGLYKFKNVSFRSTTNNHISEMTVI